MDLSFKESIKKVEQQMYVLIEANARLATNFKLINSITGVGPVTAIELILLTENRYT
jgi:biotin carboxylase